LSRTATIALTHFLPPFLLPSLPPLLSHTNRGYVAAGLDKKEMSFEVDDKVLS